MKYRRYKRTRLNEDTSFTLSKGGSPYRIYRAPNPVFNADDSMKQNWIVKRQQEQQANIQKQVTVGEIEKLKEPIYNLFRDIIEIRNTVERSKSYPMVTQKHVAVMNELQKVLDGMNDDITGKIIPLIDKLGLKSFMK